MSGVCASLRKIFLRHAEEVAGSIAEKGSRFGAGDRCSRRGAGETTASRFGGDFHLAAVARNWSAGCATVDRIQAKRSRDDWRRRATKLRSWASITIFA